MTPSLVLILLILIVAVAAVTLAITTNGKAEKLAGYTFLAALIILLWVLFGGAHVRF